jgi:ubiquinone/menaquinone biosynthesis C-methylase UbiE
MKQLIYLAAVVICFALQGEEIRPLDEPLSKQTWSHFGPLSEHYVLGRKDKPDAVYAILKSYVTPEATILDLGSGTGISTRQLCKNGFKHVIGVDRDPRMIKEAQAANDKTCTIKYMQAEVSLGLPFPDEQFDVVTASSAFHWFSNPSSIREVARILKPSGYYYVIGGKSRYQKSRQPDVIKENIERIMKDFGVALKPKKEAIPVSDLLEEQGFKIIMDATVPYVNYYTKKEFLSRIQSKSGWNLVKESQRAAVLNKIDEYLDTLLDEKGRIKKQGNAAIVLSQKIK